jgi:hypothetical protein
MKKFLEQIPLVPESVNEEIPLVLESVNEEIP